MFKSHKPNRTLSSGLWVLLFYYHWSFLTHHYELLEFVPLRWFKLGSSSVREYLSYNKPCFVQFLYKYTEKWIMKW